MATVINKDVNGIIRNISAGAVSCWYLEGADNVNYLFCPSPPTEWMVPGTPVRVVGQGNGDSASFDCGVLCFMSIANSTHRPAMEMTQYTISSASGCQPEGLQECRETDLYACVGGVWQNQGCNSVCGGECGGECTNGDTKCMSGHNYACINGTWVDQNTSCGTPPPPPVQNPNLVPALIFGAVMLGAAYYFMVYKKR